MRSLKAAGIALGALLIMALPANAGVRFRGGVFVGPAMGRWGWYDPFYYGLYEPYGPYPSYTANSGEIKLNTNVKDAEVYINGAYAGKAGKLKSIRLRPDAYSLELRAGGFASYKQQVYVIAGHTIHVNADLAAVPKS